MTAALGRLVVALGSAAIALAATAAPQAASQRPAEPQAAASQAAAPAVVRSPEPVVWPTARRAGVVSVVFRDAPIQEVLEMLARSERVNIVMRRGVTGNVSVNLFDVPLADAIRSIADAGGYAVEQPRPGEFVIVERGQTTQDTVRAGTQLRTVKVQYSNAKFVAEILAKHLSRYGKITPLLERSMLVIEDLPDYQARLDAILREVDIEPKQILIEAKILEISLDESESFGIDWTRIFREGERPAQLGIQGFAARGTPGLFFSIMNGNIEAYLNALNSKGRVHTLSTPRLLALENQEASTVIGERIGYRVTTTINLVTTESVQFLETGVILRVIPSVDEQGRILMKVHPEVSSGAITAGVPSKKSTEVTTQLLAEDGQPILIGGLIKNSANLRRNAVPLLGEIPVVGRLFGNKEEVASISETVVLITPRIVRSPSQSLTGEDQRIRQVERTPIQPAAGLESKLVPPLPSPLPVPPPALSPSDAPSPGSSIPPSTAPLPAPR